MADWNHKDERILKLAHAGLSFEQIARKIGMPGNVDRVIEGLNRKGWLPQEEKGGRIYDNLLLSIV